MGTDGRSGLYQAERTGGGDHEVRAMVEEGKATPAREERGRGGKITAVILHDLQACLASTHLVDTAKAVMS
jgi:hypothetical protein